MAASGFREWIAYQQAFKLALSIRRMTKTFPNCERYRLIDQIVRSSRSVCANLAECFGRRQYPKHYKSKLGDCITENFETQVWLDFALAEDLISLAHYNLYIEASENLGRLLSYMGRNHRQYSKAR
ncbi:MAG: four helix bundle protein [Lewinella sp.]